MFEQNLPISVLVFLTCPCVQYEILLDDLPIWGFVGEEHVSDVVLGKERKRKAKSIFVLFLGGVVIYIRHRLVFYVIL